MFWSKKSSRAKGSTKKRALPKLLTAEGWRRLMKKRTTTKVKAKTKK